MGAQIINLLKQLQRDFGLTYLFISHSMPVVRYLCNRIAVMRAGEIVELGTSEQITSAPNHPYTRTLLEATPEFSNQHQQTAFSPDAFPNPYRGLDQKKLPLIFTDDTDRKETASSSQRSAMRHGLFNYQSVRTFRLSPEFLGRLGIEATFLESPNLSPKCYCFPRNRIRPFKVRCACPKNVRNVGEFTLLSTTLALGLFVTFSIATRAAQR